MRLQMVQFECPRPSDSSTINLAKMRTRKEGVKNHNILRMEALYGWSLSPIYVLFCLMRQRHVPHTGIGKSTNPRF